MISLQSCLFDRSSQIEFVKTFLIALNKITSTTTPQSKMLIGSSPENYVPSVKRNRDSSNNSISSILLCEKDKTKTRQYGISTSETLSHIIDYLTWICGNDCIDPMQLTWGVLSIIYVSDDSKRLISSNTHPVIATNYFNGFNQRFEMDLCGQLQHIKSQKRSKLLCQAKMPTEIVLSEWILYKKIHMMVWTQKQ